MSKKKNVIIIVSILLVAILGSVFVNIGMDWFNSLSKPTQWVPNILIPIVWTIIYSVFAIILIKWSNDEKLTTKTKVLLILNGIFNILWCLIFFTLHQTIGGAVVIIINAILGFSLVVNIIKEKAIYGYILSIYPLWLSIATSLNLALWILN